MGVYDRQIVRLLCNINDGFTRLLESPNTETVTPTLYCDDSCQMVGGIGWERDAETGELLSIFFDANLEPTDVPPTGSPCTGKCFQDFEVLEDCYQDTDCVKYKRLILVSSTNGVKATSVCWVLPDGSITSDPQPDLVPCTDDCGCTSWIGGGVADALPSELITDFSIMMPECGCSGTVETSIGNVPFENVGELCFPSFKCPFTVTSISLTPESSCELTDISWLAARK